MIGAFPVRKLPSGVELGTTLADVLATRSLLGSRVLAGEAGLQRPVRSINVMEVPDVLPWVRPGQLLLTTGFPLLRDGALDPARVRRLVAELDDAGVSGLAVKLGPYLPELPGEVSAEADRRGFPLIGLPADLVFGDAMAEVLSGLLDTQAAELARVDALHRTLEAVALAGGELDSLTDAIAVELAAAVAVTTPDGRVLAAAGPAAQLTELGLFEPGGRLLVERLAGGISAVGDTQQLIATGIVAGGFEHGRLVACAPAPQLAGFGGHLMEALDRAAAVVALVMTRQLAVAAVESKYRGDFLRDALADRAGSPEQVREHCALLGWAVERPLVVLVAGLDETGPPGPAGPPSGLPLRSAQERFAAAWEQVVHARDKRAPVVGFSTEVVCLLPIDGDDPQPVVDSVVAAVAGDRGGGRRSFCTGVSRVISGPAQWPSAYAQARKALMIGRRVHGCATVTHFETLGVHRLLSLVPDPAELRSFATEVLGPLAADTAEMTDLRRTLQTLLDTNLNVAETARLLHFHYNTLRYRIGKLERMVGSFSTDPNLRLDVALALQVVQMKGL